MAKNEQKISAKIVYAGFERGLNSEELIIIKSALNSERKSADLVIKDKKGNVLYREKLNLLNYLRIISPVI